MLFLLLMLILLPTPSPHELLEPLPELGVVAEPTLGPRVEVGVDAVVHQAALDREVEVSDRGAPIPGRRRDAGEEILDRGDRLESGRAREEEVALGLLLAADRAAVDGPQSPERRARRLPLPDALERVAPFAPGGEARLLVGPELVALAPRVRREDEDGARERVGRVGSVASDLIGAPPGLAAVEDGDAPRPFEEGEDAVAREERRRRLVEEGVDVLGDARVRRRPVEEAPRGRGELVGAVARLEVLLALEGELVELARRRLVPLLAGAPLGDEAGDLLAPAPRVGQRVEEPRLRGAGKERGRERLGALLLALLEREADEADEGFGIGRRREPRRGLEGAAGAVALARPRGEGREALLEPGARVERVGPAGEPGPGETSLRVAIEPFEPREEDERARVGERGRGSGSEPLPGGADEARVERAAEAPRADRERSDPVREAPRHERPRPLEKEGRRRLVAAGETLVRGEDERLGAALVGRGVRTHVQPREESGRVAVAHGKRGDLGARRLGRLRSLGPRLELEGEDREPPPQEDRGAPRSGARGDPARGGRVALREAVASPLEGGLGAEAGPLGGVERVLGGAAVAALREDLGAPEREPTGAPPDRSGLRAPERLGRRVALAAREEEGAARARDALLGRWDGEDRPPLARRREALLRAAHVEARGLEVAEGDVRLARDREGGRILRALRQAPLGPGEPAPRVPRSEERFGREECDRPPHRRERLLHVGRDRGDARDVPGESEPRRRARDRDLGALRIVGPGEPLPRGGRLLEAELDLRREEERRGLGRARGELGGPCPRPPGLAGDESRLGGHGERAVPRRLDLACRRRARDRGGLAESSLELVRGLDHVLPPPESVGAGARRALECLQMSRRAGELVDPAVPEDDPRDREQRRDEERDHEDRPRPPDEDPDPLDALLRGSRDQRPLELVRERAGVGRTLRGLTAHGAEAERLEDRAPSGARRRGEARDAECLDRGLCLVGWPPGEDPVEDGAEPEDVRAGVHGLARRLLGRHVVEGPDHVARGREDRLPVHVARDAQVADLRRALVAHEDVLGLHVAVHDPLGVERRKAARRAEEPAARLLGRGAPLEELAQVAPLDELHGDEDGALLRDAGRVDPDDVRVVHAPQDLGLADEPLDRLLVLVLRVEELDGHAAGRDVLVDRLEDGAVSAARDEAPERVAADRPQALLVAPSVRARARLHVGVGGEDREPSVAARRADLRAVALLHDPHLVDLRLEVGSDERRPDADLAELHEVALLCRDSTLD